MKISLIMSACNQGNYLRETLENAIENVEPRFELEIVVVDDASDDDSCRDLPGDAKVVRNETRLGCSGGRRLAASLATGDVIVITDPHCWYGPNAIALVADDALGSPGIVQPRVKMEGKTRIVSSGTLVLRRDGLMMGRVNYTRPYPALYGSIYAMSRDTYERLDRLPLLPGLWGKYEQTLTGIAYRIGIPIRVVREALCTHRQYRRPKKFPYELPYPDPIRNSFWFHAGVLPDAYQRVMRRMLIAFFGDDPEYRADLQTARFVAFRNWIDDHAVLTEQQFVSRLARVDNLYAHKAVQPFLQCTTT